jgi:uncharacterized protein with FMN-binding domain
MHKRAAAALTATAGGLVLVLNFHTPEQSGAGQTASVSPSTTGRSTTTTTTSRSSAGRSSSTTTTTTAAGGSAAGGTYGDGTWTGEAASFRWGTVQVQVVVSGGRVTDVVTLQSPDDDRRSQQINQRALPTLRSEALAAQRADIDMVSGATDTSGGYIQSLQAALDQAAGAG